MEFIVPSKDEPTVLTYINKDLVNLYLNKIIEHSILHFNETIGNNELACKWFHGNNSSFQGAC